MLVRLGELAFLPVARKASDMTPIYLEEHTHSTEEYSAVLLHLQAKGLVDISYDGPLKGADMSAYTGYPVHGSAALTLRGQQTLELLETQGMID